MKKLLALGLAATVAVAGVSTLAACGGDGEVQRGPMEYEDIKVGLIALHDSNSTYDKNFIDAMEEACENKGVELVIRTGIPEDYHCYDAACDLADQDCDVIFADSFSHESFLMQAAREYPNIEFCHATGVNAAGSDLNNIHNAFASIYEGRYLAGVAAGMKLVEMYENDELKANNFDAQGNIKIGYVGAFPYAEVVSGYTSFFLGARNTVEEYTEISVSMEVTYTSSWYDEAKERNGAETLIKRGAALISQHADSMGAPSMCETLGVPNVSYNGSTASSCPNTYIISSRINWVPYFEYMIDCMATGDPIDDDWVGTLHNGAVVLTELGTAAAEGTQAKLDEVKAQLEAGTLQVFDCSTFTVSGTQNGAYEVDANGHLTSYLADTNGDLVNETQVIEDGIFYESKLRSAPYFDVRIDGITELASAE